MSEPEDEPMQKRSDDDDRDWGEHDRDYGRVRTGGDEPPAPPEGGGP